MEVVATGRNGLEAVQLIRKAEPDLVFMDVHMPGQDGMSVVRELRDSGMELPHFIFVTAYDQYAVEAFRLEAMDYLLKPVDKARLAETIDRARRSLQEKEDAGFPYFVALFALAAPYQAADPERQPTHHVGHVHISTSRLCSANDLSTNSVGKKPHPANLGP